MSSIKLLSALPVGKSAKIVEISASAPLKRRLADLGIIKGANIKAILSAPFGNPVAYGVCGTLIALRKTDSDKILIEF
jgi:ferrous iron transport protein A